MSLLTVRGDQQACKTCVAQVNNPAAQAAGADPSQCNSTSRQNPPIQQNLDFDALHDLESVKKCQYGLFFTEGTIFNRLGVTAP